MARLYATLVKVPIDGDIDDDDTTIEFTAPLKEYGEDDIAAVSGGDVMAFRLDYEIVHLTAYTPGASSGTFLRGQEGSTATAHTSGTILRHVVTDADLTGGAVPATLDDLTDVDTTSTPPTDGQALVYDDGSSLWVPGTVASGGAVDSVNTQTGAVVLDAGDIGITDAGAYFTGTDVEAALQELGAGGGGGGGGVVSGATALTNHAPNNTTAEQWAGEEVVIAQADAPDTEVVVMGWLAGGLSPNSGVGSPAVGDRGLCYLEVTFDGGSSWATLGSTTLAHIVDSSSNQRTTPLSATGRATGTVTGDIMVRAMCRDVTQANDCLFKDGYISVMVFPYIAPLP